MNAIPEAILALVDELMTMPGAVAVALGGSRALGVADSGSDWDLGLYYRNPLELSTLASRGPVYPPGSWGRLMNGGAWLECGGMKVDVLLRDLDVAEQWWRRAQQGEFEIDALLGYVAGVPTYLHSAELASCRTLRGVLPSAPFPSRLQEMAPVKWRFCRSFSLDYARMHARRGDVVGTTAQAAKAVVEEAHALVCGRGQWVCNEKRLVEIAGLTGVQSMFTGVPAEPALLLEWVDQVATFLQVGTDEAKPWAGVRQPMVDEPIHLEAYREEWPAIFQEERARIVAALGVPIEVVQHIGSTAVDGLGGKPVVDILIGASTVPCPDAWTASLVRLGYEAMGEAGLPGRWYFRQRVPPFRNAHVVEVGGSHWINNLAFRDYLRGSPDACATYMEAKRLAVANGATSLVAYTRAKRMVIEGLLARALAIRSAGPQA